MNKATLTIAEQIALVVNDFEEQRTGHRPKSVSVVLSDETLVITLHGALSPADRTHGMAADAWSVNKSEG